MDRRDALPLKHTLVYYSNKNNLVFSFVDTRYRYFLTLLSETETIEKIGRCCCGNYSIIKCFISLVCVGIKLKTVKCFCFSTFTWTSFLKHFWCETYRFYTNSKPSTFPTHLYYNNLHYDLSSTCTTRNIISPNYLIQSRTLLTKIRQCCSISKLWITSLHDVYMWVSIS